MGPPEGTVSPHSAHALLTCRGRSVRQVQTGKRRTQAAPMPPSRMECLTLVTAALQPEGPAAFSPGLTTSYLCPLDQGLCPSCRTATHSVPCRGPGQAGP